MFGRLGIVAALLAVTSAQAQDALPATFDLNGETGQFFQAERPDLERLSLLATRPEGCGAVCIAPNAIPGTATIGEAEVMAFVAGHVASGAGLLIDSRPAARRDAGTILGSVNVPATLLLPANPYRDDILRAFGGVTDDGSFDFSNAIPLVVYDNGPLETDASRLIASLHAAGYPTDRIRYFHGGLLSWVTLGLSVEETAS